MSQAEETFQDSAASPHLQATVQTGTGGNDTPGQDPLGKEAGENFVSIDPPKDPSMLAAQDILNSSSR
jgi:hypothetical protein